MPFLDLEKRREYSRKWKAAKREAARAKKAEEAKKRYSFGPILKAWK